MGGGIVHIGICVDYSEDARIRSIRM